MSMIAGVRDWLRQCPGLSGEQLHVDWLPESARAYSVIAQPATAPLMQYLDRSTVERAQYIIASQQFMASDIAEAMENLDWFEEFAAWLRECSYLQRLPDLGAGKTALRVELASGGYPLQVDYSGLAQYQAQITIVYFQAAPAAREE